MAKAKANLLRFVTLDRHEPFGHRTGVVHKAVELRDSPGQYGKLRDELADEVNWLNEHMPSPERFTRTSRANADEVAISWVKGEAKQHVDCLRRMGQLLSTVGLPVECLRTSRPGFVVYEDDVQVVAVPFKDTPQ